MHENLIYRQRWWILGRPAPIWLRYRDVVKEFVSQNRLQVIQREHLAALDLGAPFESTARPEAVFKPRPFPGGLRTPHVHLGDDIYQLDPKEWNSFTRAVIDSFRAKLDSAGTVGFEQFMELSDAMDALG